MFDEEENLLEENVEIIETQDRAVEPLEVVISGLLLEDERDALKSLCCEESDTTLPFIIRVDYTKKMIGHIKLDLSTLLKIYMISPNYSVKLINNVTSQERELFDKENISKSLEMFISL